MGCCACIHKREIISGNIENLIVLNIKQENIGDYSQNFNNEQNSYIKRRKKIIYQINKSTDKELLTINQQRADEILEYFNQIKLKPLNFLEEAKQHDVIDVLNQYIETKDRSIFIKNRFYNSLLESYINRTPQLEIEIKKGINNESNLNKYDKQFYVVNSTIQDPNESIWALIKQNKNNALDKLLIIKTSYLALCVYPIENSPNIKVYFLFLQIKKN